MKTLLYLICLLFSISTIAQQGTPPIAGARGLAMGNTSTIFSDIHSVTGNQAGIAFMEKWGFMATGQTRFLPTGTQDYTLAFAIPNTPIGALGLSFNHFGWENYNEEKIGVAYARKLSEQFSLGIQIDYLATHIAEYGTAHNVLVEVGMFSKINEHLLMGVHAYNPLPVRLKTGDALPALFKWGAAYLPSKGVIISAELEKGIDTPFAGRVGLEYRLIDAFAIRTGISTNPLLATFGTGIYVKDWQINLGSSYHQILGFSTSLSVSYQLGTAEQYSRLSGAH